MPPCQGAAKDGAAEQVQQRSRAEHMRRRSWKPKRDSDRRKYLPAHTQIVQQGTLQLDPVGPHRCNSATVAGRGRAELNSAATRGAAAHPQNMVYPAIDSGCSCC